jgi:N-acetyl sugar amidotransferase|tara:strand:- start:7500 stop:8600 length:1101 start_codon:yes stop_codon:yes gene_type:complete
MDSSDSKISFDKNGKCDHCQLYEKTILPKWNQGKGHKDELDKIVKALKKAGKGKDFDCILGMSGGIDSSYLLYLTVKKLGLRPLVFHVDGGWNSQIAVNNIEKLVDGLGVDLFTEVIDWEEMKDLQRAFFRSGISHIDTPQDHAFFATMYKFASKFDVKHIITGVNHSTECIRNPKEWMYYQSDSIQLRDIHNNFGSNVLKNFPITNILWHKIYLPYFRGIKTYRLLDLMEYNKEEATQFLVDNYGFERYPQKHFESRFTKFYESYWLPERFGYDTRKVQYSSLIVTDQMSRSDALENLKNPSFDSTQINREFEYIADKLDMSIEELKACFDMPKKTYQDYKHQEAFYNIGAWILRKIGVELGGKR